MDKAPFCHQKTSMCSDAVNGEYEGIKVKNESGCSWAEEATTSESRLHLNDILEMLIRLDQQGIFMNPVDDSIAPDYSKVIKKPMCFLKMREKIYAEQYMSWDSFVEDFECICYNAMKYNQKRSKIWNAANLILRQGKRCLEQQASRQCIIIGISNVHNGINLCEKEIAEKVDMDHICQGTQLEALPGNPDEPINVISTENLVSNFSERQGPNIESSLAAVNETVVGDERTVSPSGRLSVNEDVIVEILDIQPEEDIRLNIEDQATECSSSFTGIQSELEGECCEVESEFRDGNGANVPTENSAVPSRRRRRALDSDWKAYRQGIEWRCRWFELRVEELQAESNKYMKILEAAKTRKENYQQDGTVARTSSMNGYIHKNLVLRRRQRRRDEENVGFTHMSKHPVFSRYGKRKQLNQELSSTEEGVGDEELHILEFDDFNLDEDKYEDNIVVENDSMEHYLWQIEMLQMHTLTLKNQLMRGATIYENKIKVHPKNTSPVPTLLGSPRNLNVPSTHVGLGPRSTMRGSKGQGGTSSSRRRNSDFDINNVIMPDFVTANYVEPPRHAFIETPHWRLQENVTALNEEVASSEEDTDDEVYRIRHTKMQRKERQQQYTPLTLNKGRPISQAKERPKSDMVEKVSNTVATSIVDTSVDNESTIPTTFGYIPKRKRNKRESLARRLP